MIPKVHQDTLTLQQLIESQANGASLSFMQIEHDSKVRMDERGKSLLRRALKRARREYSTVRGYGIRLADPDSVLPILSTRIIKIDSAVRKADKTHRILHDQFFASLTADQQRSVLYAGAVFGAIRLAAQNGKALYSKNRELPHSLNIPVPKF